MKRVHLVAAVGLFLITATASWGQKVFYVPVMKDAPVIDGTVSPQEMKDCASTTMTLIGTLDRPKFATDAYVGVTTAGLYLGFVCSDPAPDKAVAKTKAENGPVFLDDSVEVFLAPAAEASKTNYFHFALNSAGTAYSDGMERDLPVTNWQHASKPSTGKWEAELFIPSRSVFAPSDLPFWRANFSRNRPARPGEVAEQSVWVDPGTTLHNYKRFGYLRFASGTGFKAFGETSATAHAVGSTTATALATTASATAAASSTSATASAATGSTSAAPVTTTTAAHKAPAGKPAGALVGAPIGTISGAIVSGPARTEKKPAASTPVPSTPVGNKDKALPR